jgi:hypothetical protein
MISSISSRSFMKASSRASIRTGLSRRTFLTSSDASTPGPSKVVTYVGLSIAGLGLAGSIRQDRHPGEIPITLRRKPSDFYTLERPSKTPSVPQLNLESSIRIQVARKPTDMYRMETHPEES